MSTESQSLRSLPILVVEDDEGLNRLISRRLKRLGFVVESCECAAAAREVLAEQELLLLLVDYTLPDGSGADLVNQVPPAERPPFIVMTGRGDERLAVQMMKLGATDYLVKDAGFLEALPEVIQRTVTELETKAELATARQQARESELFAQAVLDSLSNRIAVIDADGVIEAVNAAWRDLAERTGAARCGPGVNYLAICDATDDDYADSAHRIAAGIRQVLTGEQPTFEHEYPCKVEDDTLWFRVRVSCFPGDGPNRAVISHEDLTEHKSMEQRVAQSQRLLSFAMRQVSIPVLIVSAPDSEVIEANGAARRLMKDPSLPLEKISIGPNTPSWDCRLPGGAACPAIRFPISQAISNGKPTYNERLIMKAPHGERIVLATAAPLRDDKGAIIAGIMVFPDITDLEHTREALSKSEQRLSQVFNVAPVGFAIVHERRFSFVNEQVCQMLGCEPDDLLGKRTRIIYRSDEEFEQVGQRLIDRLAVESVVTLERPFVRPDGNEIDLFLRISMLDPQDLQAGIVIAAIDITERKQAERERVMLKSAIDQAGEAVVITDTQGVIQYVNPAFEEISGYASEEVIGQNPSVLQSGEHDLSFYRRLWDTIREGRVWQGRFRNRRKDGTLFWEDAIIAPVYDADGKIVNFVATKHDITEDLELRERLEHKDRLQAVGELAGSVAHDFNNLLTPIIGFSSMLLTKLNDRDSLHRPVSRIHEAADRARSLTQQLLAFSRRQVFEMEALDLNEVILSFEDMMRGAIREDVHMTLVLADDLGLLRGNASQIEQVLMNLTVNARDAMPEGGSLTVTTANCVVDDQADRLDLEPGEYVTITIADTGEGMDHETANHLFEPFFTTKEKGKGTGLGLATVYGIVRQHGGDIVVTSKVGEGANFTMYFPRISGEERQARPATEKQPLKESEHEVIAVVEDSHEVREVVMAILSDHGYEVQAYASPSACLDDLTEPPDLLLTDVVMPGINGAELSEKLRRRFPKMKVLFMSGYAADQIYQRILRIEGARLIQKPFRPEDLLDIVQQVLNG